MITPDTFDAFIEALTKEGFITPDGGKAKNNPTNIFIRGITGSDLDKIFAILPPGVWPDFCLMELPSNLKRSPSQYIMIFEKVRGLNVPVVGQVEEVPAKKTKGKGGGTAPPDETE